MTTQPRRFIAIEGPIGVGKTTLARRLAADLDAALLLEPVQDNPFLADFYREPQRFAFPLQVQFLLARLDQLETALAGADGPLVADYLLEKDRLFAENTLDERAFALYEALWQRLVDALPQPDLVIYLQAPVAVLQARIAARGRRFERSISADYLARLDAAYTRFFHYYDAAPLLIVNAAEIDLVDSEDDYRRLFEQIHLVRSGRHYFNPVAAGRQAL